jgi:hypothetical protein
MANGIYSLTYRDYNGEASTVEIPTVEIDEVNLAAQDALMDAAKTAIEAVMVDPVPSKDKRTFAVTALAAPNAKASDSDAQRERKWLVLAHDAITFVPLRLEIPCADLAQLDANDRERMDISGGAGAALVAALEALWTNKQTGNAVVIDEVRHVGRNT